MAKTARAVAVPMKVTGLITSCRQETQSSQKRPGPRVNAQAVLRNFSTGFIEQALELDGALSQLDVLPATEHQPAPEEESFFRMRQVPK